MGWRVEGRVTIHPKNPIIYLGNLESEGEWVEVFGNFDEYMKYSG